MNGRKFMDTLVMLGLAGVEGQLETDDNKPVVRYILYPEDGFQVDAKNLAEIGVFLGALNVDIWKDVSSFKIFIDFLEKEG